MVELDDLVAFVQHPVKAFLRQRLGIVGQRRRGGAGGRAADRARRASSSGASASGCWTQRLAGVDLDACLAAERVRGVLPPGVLGEPILDEVVPIVEDIVAAADGTVATTRRPHRWTSTSTSATAGRSIGTVPGWSATCCASVTYSRVGAKQRLAAWVRLLALTAAAPGPAVLRRHRGPRQARRVRHGPHPSARNRSGGPSRRLRSRICDVLVDLYARGMREPLPLYCKTSAAYAAARPATDRPGQRAATGSPARSSTTRTANREHQLVLGGVVPFDELLGAPPRRRRGRARLGGRRADPVRPATPGGCGTDCCAVEELVEPVTRTMTGRAFDVCGTAAVGRDGARGQRRHGQDLHHRRAGRPLRRRGHAARTGCCS